MLKSLGVSDVCCVIGGFFYCVFIKRCYKCNPIMNKGKCAMDLIVMYAIENICQQKVSYDTSLGYFNSKTAEKANLVMDDLDIEWVFNEIENMCTLTFDDDVRCWIANKMADKTITVSDLIHDVETQALLFRAQRNPAGHPKCLKQEKLSLLKMDKCGLRCALTEQKCDKIPQCKTADVKDVCVRSNCKIAQNFYNLARKTR